MPATPTNKPSAQLPIGSPDWKTASEREEQERRRQIDLEEGRKARAEREKLKDAVGNLPLPADQKQKGM